MKNLRFLLFATIAMMLVFSSCRKEEVSEIEDVIPPTETVLETTNPLVPQMQFSMTNNDALDLGCFAVDVPFELNVDGTIVAINDYTEFEETIVDGAELVDFVYPINITYQDGTTEVVEDGEQLGEAFANCIPDTGWGENSFPVFLISDESSCYSLVYPLNVVDTEGTVTAVDSQDELVDLVSTGELYFFEFPISLNDDEGNTVSATNDEELFALLMECEIIETDIPGGDPINDCWEYQYPFDMTDQDGNTVTINTHDDICNASLNGLELEYNFPLTLVNPEGEELVVNNMGELTEAFLECFPDFEGVDLDLGSFIGNSALVSNPNCYSIIYPLDYINNDTGESNSINDDTAALEYLNSTQEWGDVIVLPITVIDVSSGDEITIEDLNGYFEYIFTCN